MADLLTFVDIQTQVSPQTVSPAGNNISEGGAGFFDSLMNEIAADTEILNIQMPEIATEITDSNLITFKGGKLFSNSVLDIITADTQENVEINFNGEAENLLAALKDSFAKIQDAQPEVFYSEEEINLNEEFSQLLNLTDEELSEKLNSLPEDLKNEIKNLIDEINNALENGEDFVSVKSAVEKLSVLFNRNSTKSEISLEAKNDGKILEKEKNTGEKLKSEAEINSANAAGAVAVMSNVNPASENVNFETKSQNSNANDETSKLNSKISQHVQTREIKTQNEIKAGAETDSVVKSDEAAENPDEKNQNLTGEKLNLDDESESEKQNSDSNFGQARENFSGSHGQQRSRNDSRKISNENSLDYEGSENSTAHKTNPHGNFQNFFDGILNSRRTSSTALSQPLNLRENFNFNQSETLRDGLVNVVRFIRADGVQKASIVIDPPALGRISVELTSNSSGVEASIKVASEQIRQLVQDQLTQLRMNLSEQGVQVAEFTVDIQQDSSNGGNSQNPNQQNRRENFFTEAEEDDEEEFRIDLEEGLLYWIA